MAKKKSKRTQFSETFKIRAVNLAAASKQSVSQTARELGISEKTLHSWIAGKTANEAAKSVAKSIVESSEVEILRAEVRKLEQQRDILRDALKFFANEK
jgi:transposase